MPTYDLSTMANVKVALGSEAMGNSADFSFSYLPDLAGEDTIKQDDLVYYDAHGRRLYKGLVKRIEHSLTDESVTAKCEAADRFIDGQLWEPVYDYYNDLEAPSCADRAVYGKTIQDFFTTEFTNRVSEEGSPKQWFTSVTIAASVQDLPLPPMTTLGKGFITCIQNIFSAYPYIRYVIEFDATTNLFPVGTLTLFDARVGRSSHSLTVGAAGKQVVDLNVSQTIEDCAEEIRVHARGKFVERYELLRPNWNPAEERILEQDIIIDKPDEENGSSRLPEGHEFIWEIQLWAQNATYYPPPGVGVFADSYRLFPGADFKINIETGEILWLHPDEGEDWWWVNRENGTIKKTVAGANALGWGDLNDSLYRRPFTYNNEHIKEGVYILAGQYYRLGERAYRCYKTKYPIADFRIERHEVDEIDPNTGLKTGQRVDEYRRMETEVEIFIPKVATERFMFEEPPEDQVVSFDDIWPAPTGTDRENWNAWFTQINQTFAIDPEEDPSEEDQEGLPEIEAWMLFPRVDLSDERSILRWFVKSGTGVSFEPGTKCADLGQRQLVSVPEVYEKVHDQWYSANPPVGTNFCTWAVLARYVSWEEYFVERTNTLGLGRRYTGVMDSVFSYDQLYRRPAIEEEEERVQFDNIADLDSIADDVAEFYGTEDWEGTITVSVSLNTVSKKWIIPYKVGDVVTLTGNVSAGLAGFQGLIRQITYQDMNAGIIALEFGKMEPRKNPYAPPYKKQVDLVGDHTYGPDQGGLQDMRSDFRG
jgi:hypothetical protein